MKKASLIILAGSCLCFSSCKVVGSSQLPHIDILDQAKKEFGYDISCMVVFECDRYDWVPGEKIFIIREFLPRTNKLLMYSRKEGMYNLINGKSEISHINRLLKEYKFKKENFNNEEASEYFLRFIVNLHKPMLSDMLTPISLKCRWADKDGNPSGLRAHIETDMEEVKALFQKSVFVFSGEKWNVKFNVINDGGSVDQWEITGTYHKKEQINQLDDITIRNIKKSGAYTFLGLPEMNPCGLIDCRNGDSTIFKEVLDKNTTVSAKLSQLSDLDILSRARKDFGYEIKGMEVYESDLYPWLKEDKIFTIMEVHPKTNKKLIYYRKEGVYYRMNCDDGIPYINWILKGKKFNKKNFENEKAVESLLHYIVKQREPMLSDILTPMSFEYRLSERDGSPADFLMRGKEKDKEELKSLFQKPVFVFSGEKWNAKLNVINDDGSVDQWVITGTYHEKEQINQLDKIIIHNLKKPGAYSY